VTLAPFRPVPAPSVRPWAGSRLAPADAHVGELWLAGPDSRVVGSDGGTLTLDELAAIHGPALVGTAGMARYGARFPLLVKLIDAADWLSLQVHPDDALARELYGPEAVGKAEAWVVLDADEGTELVTGPADDLDATVLLTAIASGEAGHRHCRHSPATPGDTLMLEPGTLHAIGPGTLVYEIEQPSDITFRISDWGRPGRTLHTAESVRALRPARHAQPAGAGFRLDGGVLTAEAFRLELTRKEERRTPGGQSPEVVSVLAGSAVARGDGWTEMLRAWETVVVPAATGAYVVEPASGAVVGIGRVA
jgi:mannose-6-phosphate isomerase